MMTGCEKIIDRIREDGAAAVAAVKAEAEQKAALLLEQADLQAEQAKAEILADGEQQAERLRRNALSACELEKRNASLLCRRAEIDRTVETLLRTLCDLPDEAYFDLLVTLAAGFAGKEGELRRNEKDLARMPADLLERMKAVGVTATVCPTPCPIAGGFRLTCGDIEYCADFAALIEEKRDAIEDLIHRELFR